jgi:hypothetical protein
MLSNSRNALMVARDPIQLALAELAADRRG